MQRVHNRQDSRQSLAQDYQRYYGKVCNDLPPQRHTLLVVILLWHEPLPHI